MFSLTLLPQFLKYHLKVTPQNLLNMNNQNMRSIVNIFWSRKEESLFGCQDRQCRLLPSTEETESALAMSELSTSPPANSSSCSIYCCLQITKLMRDGYQTDSSLSISPRPKRPLRGALYTTVVSRAPFSGHLILRQCFLLDYSANFN